MELQFYDTTEIEYQVAGSYNVTVPADIDQAEITLVGGGGSGAVYSNDGNNGGFSRFDIASGGSILRINCGGGSKGGSASSSEGGSGGATGSNTVTGSAAATTTIIGQGGGSGYDGGDGGDGPYWKKNLENPSATPSGANGTAGTNPSGRNGTEGKSRIVNETGNVVFNFPYNTSNQNWTN